MLKTFYYIFLSFNMSQKQRQRLEFKVKNPQNEQKIGSSKMINPLSLVPAEAIPYGQGHKSQIHQFQGTFVDDYLLAEDGPQKGKKIVKRDKRAHYKTRMCPHGRQCKKQLTCTFAHTEYELRKPFMKRKTMCKLYQMGRCHLGSACRQYHGNIDLMKKNYKYKAQICKDFQQGKCGKGNVCIYIHEIIEKNDQIQQKAEKNQNNSENIDEKVIVLNETTQQINQDKFIEKKAEKSKKQIVQIVQQQIGQEKIVEDGLNFDLNFN